MNPRPDHHTIREYLRLLGHRIALVGLKPIGNAPKNTVIWPIDQDDVVDQACGLSDDYYSVYVNLNPLHDYMHHVSPAPGKSVKDAMIAQRRRVLIDVDAHEVDKSVALEQADAIIKEIGSPLLFADSGNGYTILYECDLPNDDQSKYGLKSYLEQLNSRYSCVDKCVYGAGRLTRLIGTLNRCKVTGDRIPTFFIN